MTDKQYEGMLLDQQLQWKETLALAQKAGNEEIIAKAQQQIDLIDEKLKD